MFSLLPEKEHCILQLAFHELMHDAEDTMYRDTFCL